MKRYRLLHADEIECRVAQCTEKGVSILLYKTARTDADILDETVGSENWENDFKLVDGVLYGGIGVDYGRGLVWKWDAGTESNTEAEKGRASDAFKRAGFKHGIGRELYSAPFIWISKDLCNIKQDSKGKWKCYDNFNVVNIAYDRLERISALTIAVKGVPVYEMGKPTKKTEVETPLVCTACGNLISDSKAKNGEVWSAYNIMEYSKTRYGKPLCAGCIKNAG